MEDWGVAVWHCHEVMAGVRCHLIRLLRRLLPIEGKPELRWGSRRLLDGEGQFRFGGNLAVYAGYGLADAHGTHAAGQFAF